jgi:hypothetical protein
MKNTNESPFCAAQCFQANKRLQFPIMSQQINNTVFHAKIASYLRAFLLRIF